jgi:hypothetical protein
MEAAGAEGRAANQRERRGRRGLARRVAEASRWQAAALLNVGSCGRTALDASVTNHLQMLQGSCCELIACGK